jgi:hypothetical protein
MDLKLYVCKQEKHCIRYWTNFGSLSIDIACNLFDKMIVPMLLYACEIWGFEHRPLVHLIQITFCRYMISVGIRTSNLACLDECGRKPLQVLYLTRCITYRIKFVRNHTDNKYTNNWAIKIRTLLYNYGFGDVWTHQWVGNIEVFLHEFEQRVSFEYVVNSGPVTWWKYQSWELTGFLSQT